MIGEGIKKIPAYKCTIPYDKLNKLIKLKLKLNGMSPVSK